MSTTKKALEDSVIKVVDTVEIFIAWKKVTQCKATSNPPKPNFSKSARFSLNRTLRTFKYKKRVNDANNTLNQTKGMASMEIKAPRIAVKPHMNTMKWRCS